MDGFHENASKSNLKILTYSYRNTTFFENDLLNLENNKHFSIS